MAIPITGELDLHTFRPAEIADLLENYLAECQRRDLLRVRVVHFHVGERPVWRLDSAALFYWAPGGRLMETPMKKGRELTQPLAPRRLFTVPFGPTAYAASLDGTRFLMAIPIGYQQPSR